MAKSELYEKGLALRTQLFGESYAEKMNESTYSDPVMQKFRDLAAETVFGALWTRPGLDLKTRTLVCVVSDAATGREPELRLHLRMARRQGAMTAARVGYAASSCTTPGSRARRAGSTAASSPPSSRGCS